MVWVLSGNSNGLWLAPSFWGDAHHFNTSLWSVFSNVSNPRSNIRFHARNNRSNSGSFGSGMRVNWLVLIILCLDWLITLFYLVYRNHESTSTLGMFFNNSKRRSFASAFHFSIPCIIGSLASSWPLSSPLLRSLSWLYWLSFSSPVSRIRAALAWRSYSLCFSSSTTQYRAFFSLNHDCICTIRYNSTSSTLCLLCSLFPCCLITDRFWESNWHS